MGHSTRAIAKGVAAEHLAKLYFIEKGYGVLTPETHEKPYDFVLDTDEGFLKVQVKAESYAGDLVRFRNKHGQNRSYKEQDYDILAGVWVDKRKIYLFHSSVVNQPGVGETISVETKTGRPIRKKKKVLSYYETGSI